jgi:purine-nucleoside phosphorylase
MEAVFAAVPGPSMPTRAEYRFLRRAGADLVGMSLVPEVLAAVHSGFEVLALVGILETVHVESSEPTDIELMLDAAELAAPRMASLINGIVASLDQ